MFHSQVWFLCRWREGEGGRGREREGEGGRGREKEGERVRAVQLVICKGVHTLMREGSREAAFRRACSVARSRSREARTLRTRIRTMSPPTVPLLLVGGSGARVFCMGGKKIKVMCQPVCLWFPHQLLQEGGAAQLLSCALVAEESQSVHTHTFCSFRPRTQKLQQNILPKNIVG